ncbi:hypothetical protein BHM03_00032286 [Ensete ventricosum]|uniref:Uncharacterized protein n=1 Tax=Ensete ventricosum TaxID=4639 RepID=A0A445MIN5_ENSVE|nr:hypothetical protein BHM03_00032286 [Ensete ventricosum]
MLPFPGLYMYEGYNYFIAKRGIPRTNIIATRDTHVQRMLLIIDFEGRRRRTPGFFDTACQIND